MEGKQERKNEAQAAELERNEGKKKNVKSSTATATTNKQQPPWREEKPPKPNEDIKAGRRENNEG